MRAPPTAPAAYGAASGADVREMHRTARATQVVGAALLLAGVIVAGYLIWALWLTGLSADRTQDELGQRWAREVSGVRAAPTAVATPAASPARANRAAPDTRAAPRPAPGGLYAVLRFARPGESTPLMHREPLYVVEGTGREELRVAPGHYPQSSAPGEQGNFAVAGHRTTYGAPFRDLDQLQAGDVIHVTDLRDRQWTYTVVKQRIVGPDDDWVLDSDPLGTGAATLTLTTCHPVWSAARRLVVFAVLAERGSHGRG